MPTKGTPVGGSSVFSALGFTLSWACCGVPVLGTTIAVGSSALTAYFVVLRPYLVALTFIALGFGFYSSYKKSGRGCAENSECASARSPKWPRALLWVAAGASLILLILPYWSGITAYFSLEN